MSAVTIVARAKPRSLAGPVPSGRRRARGARTWRGGSWRRSPSRSGPRSGARRTASPRSRRGRRHYAQNARRRGFKKTSPPNLSEDPDEAPERRRDAVVARCKQHDTARRITLNADGGWHAPAGAPRPAHRMGLYLRRDLERRRAGHALVRHRRHGGAPLEISAAVDPGAHADRRSGRWHLTPKLARHHRPAAATIELNPVENVWQFMRTGCRTGKSYEELSWPEQPHRPTEDHVPRHARAWVLINDRWF